MRLHSITINFELLQYSLYNIILSNTIPIYLPLEMVSCGYFHGRGFFFALKYYPRLCGIHRHRPLLYLNSKGLATQCRDDTPLSGTISKFGKYQNVGNKCIK